MSKCIFCAIVSGETPAEVVYQDDKVLAFPDVNPHAPVHLLIVPREHIENLDTLTDDQRELASHLLYTARQLGRQHGGDQGYRVALNSTHQADVNHMHVHVLAGAEKLGPLARGGE